MATPITYAMAENGYHNFIMNSLADGHGGWIRDPNSIQTSAQDEFIQITATFQVRLFHLARAADILEQAASAMYMKTDQEYWNACAVWDTLTPGLLAAERQFMVRCLQRFENDSKNLDAHLQAMLADVQTFNTDEAQRVRQLFALPLQMRVLIECINRRMDANTARAAEVDGDKDAYQNPSQTAQSGNKVLGKHETPRAVKELSNRQVLFPLSTVGIAPWVPVLSALPNEDGHTWEGTELGAGGMGSTRLYTQSDAQGTAVDRIVIKDTHEAESAARFRGANNWHGDITTDDWQSTCIPLEYHTQKIAGDDTNGKNTVRVFGRPRVDFNHCVVRFMMEYSPEGDLWQVIKRQQDHEEPIPERFIWLCFQGLVNACVIMKQGSLDKQLNPWSEIVHMDLKPANIFLGLPETGYYPQWPTAQVGDFGLAFVTSSNDAINPLSYSRAGTPGHLASEQRDYVDSETGCAIDIVKMLSPCNVYGIATVLFAMIEQRNLGNSQPSFLPGVLPGEYRVDPFFRSIYSADLCLLVQNCLVADPGARPTVDQLKEYIDGKMASDEFEFDRKGFLRPDGDTLLLPNHDVRLKWASRMNGQADAPRVPRSPGSGSTVYSDPDPDDQMSSDREDGPG